MPFDPLNYERQPPSDDPSSRRVPGERVFLWLFAAFAVLLMLLPITPEGVADLWHYARGD